MMYQRYNSFAEALAKRQRFNPDIFGLLINREQANKRQDWQAFWNLTEREQAMASMFALVDSTDQSQDT